jgi:hypothetical protein
VQPAAIEALFAGTIFISAFLLFLVQPLVAKQILPWFGGSAAVCSVCMVFFQVALLAGYAYADWISRRLRPRTHEKTPPDKCPRGWIREAAALRPQAWPRGIPS